MVALLNLKADIFMGNDWKRKAASAFKRLRKGQVVSLLDQAIYKQIYKTRISAMVLWPLVAARLRNALPNVMFHINTKPQLKFIGAPSYNKNLSS